MAAYKIDKVAVPEVLLSMNDGSHIAGQVANIDSDGPIADRHIVLGSPRVASRNSADLIPLEDFHRLVVPMANIDLMSVRFTEVKPNVT